MFLTIDLNKNFWDVNPSAIAVEGFKSLFDDVGKRRSSNIMWSIYLAYHPKSDVFRANDSIEDREANVNTTFNSKESYVDFSKYVSVIELFEDVYIPKSLRFLSNWEQELKDFDLLIKNEPFTEKNSKKRIEWLSARPVLWNLFLEAKESYDIDSSRAKSANRGGYQGSMMENGGLEE